MGLRLTRRAFIAMTVIPYYMALRRALAGGGVPGGIESASMEGVWTWFNDPRAISVAGAPAIGVVRNDGRIGVYHATVPTPTITLLRAGVFQVNDHATPSLLKRASDSRILAFASAHHGAAIYTYLSTNPDDVSAFGAETSISGGWTGFSGFTYVSPVQLTGLTDDPILLFFRAEVSGTRHTYYTISTDSGATFGTPTRLLTNSGASVHPPYVKVAQNGDSRVDVFCTTGHPQFVATNSLYHLYYDGAWRESDGTALSLPVLPSTDLTAIYDGAGAGGRAWVHDAAIDGSGNPVCAYAVYPSTSNHRYRYTKWDGVSAWDDNEVAHGGGYLYAAQPYYSGGIGIDPANVNIVYLSRGDAGVGNHKIYRYVTADGGDTWSGTKKTSSGHSFRPFVVRGGGAEPRLAYVSGTYTTYENYSTTIELVNGGAGAAIDDPVDAQFDNVLLLMQANTQADLSKHGRALTWGENITIDGDEIVFPGTAVGADIEKVVISTPDVAAWTFAGDFCLELFGVKFSSNTIDMHMLSHWRSATASRSWTMAYRGSLATDTLAAFTSEGGTTSTVRETAWTPTVGTPYDLCFERSGTDFRIFIGAVMVHKETWSGSLNNSPARVLIGSIETGTTPFPADVNNEFQGRMKSVRITNAARYASDADRTVPSLPLPTS